MIACAAVMISVVIFAGSARSERTSNRAVAYAIPRAVRRAILGTSRNQDQTLMHVTT
jgi:hypothetical protein